nr:Trm112 family protein [Azospirillum halopraeferens]
MSAPGSAPNPDQTGASDGAAADARGRVDRKLLEILVCPLTKGPLRYDAERGELVSERAGLAYPIRDGIPIMLVDEARRLDDAAGGTGD